MHGARGLEQSLGFLGYGAFPVSLHSPDGRHHLRLWNMRVVASTEIKMSMWEKLVSKGRRVDLDRFGMCILDDS